MATSKKIIEWINQADPLAGQGYLLLGEESNKFAPPFNCEGTLLQSECRHYAVKLSEVEDFSPDRAMIDNERCLFLCEINTCDWLIDHFVEVCGMNSFRDVFPLTIFGAYTPLQVVDTHYGFSVLIWVSWNARTYSGDIYFPVEGMNEDEAKGLLHVRLALMKQALPIGNSFETDRSTDGA